MNERYLNLEEKPFSIGYVLLSFVWLAVVSSFMTYIIVDAKACVACATAKPLCWIVASMGGIGLALIGVNVFIVPHYLMKLGWVLLVKRFELNLQRNLILKFMLSVSEMVAGMILLLLFVLVR